MIRISGPFVSMMIAICSDTFRTFSTIVVAFSGRQVGRVDPRGVHAGFVRALINSGSQCLSEMVAMIFVFCP